MNLKNSTPHSRMDHFLHQLHQAPPAEVFDLQGTLQALERENRDMDEEEALIRLLHEISKEQ